MGSESEGARGWRAGPPFINDGGPLIVLPAESLPDWTGAIDLDGPIETREDDYGRACRAADPAELIGAGSGVGLVLGGGLSEVRWLWPPGANTPLLAGWYWGEDGCIAQLQEVIEAGGLRWSRLLGTMTVRSGALVLFHAADSGAQHSLPRDAVRTPQQAGIGDVLLAPIATGEYAIEIFIANDERGLDGMSGEVYRWTPVHPR